MVAAETTLVVLVVQAAVAMVDILLQVEQAHLDKATMVAQAQAVPQLMPQVVVGVPARQDLLLQEVVLVVQVEQDKAKEGANNFKKSSHSIILQTGHMPSAPQTMKTGRDADFGGPDRFSARRLSASPESASLFSHQGRQ